ncbi:MAG: hypothetical protein JW940_06180 [Polyangiaceae bacterium]|nr:hypothetical protein [Polyangiaceae bacterium]
MKHSVKFTIPWRELGNADVEFQVWGDSDKIGTLQISKGALVWFPKDRSYGHRISWSKFSRMMEDYPRAEKR